MIIDPLYAVGGFGSIGMLAWASAALLPLLLHLWNRRQHKDAPWAAMEFLLAAVQEQARRMRLEQILLLLLRMAIPIVLSLALADPIWHVLPALGSSLGSRVPHHHLFVFDTSYSMGYEVDGRTRLDHAKLLASEVIESSPQGDGFTIVIMSNPSEQIVAEPVFSAGDAATEVSQLQLRDHSADLASAIRIAKQTVDFVGESYERLQRHRVYFFSDMGANTWRAGNSPAVRKLVGELETLAEIVTVDVGATEVANAGLTSVRRSVPIVTPGDAVTWQLHIDDFTGNASGQHAVEMFVDGKLAAKQNVQLTSGEPTSTAFRYQFDAAKAYSVEFRLAADALPVDNHRFEAVNVRDALNILCVEGKTGAAQNVALALAPTEGSIRVRTIPDHRLSETLLSDYDAVFYCNLGRFTAERVTQLRDYLKRGRSVVLFLGDLVSIENYNHILGSDETSPPILPARLIELSGYASHRFLPEDYQHPIIQPFRGQERTGLLTTPVWKYVRLQLPSDTLATTVLKYANDDPAILEHEVSGGRMMLVSIAPSEQSVSQDSGHARPWTAWSAWPSFPPMIQEMLTFAISCQDQDRNLTVGEPLSATLPASSGAQYVTARLPKNNASRRLAVQEGTGPPYWMLDDTVQSGFYHTEIADIEATQTFAVNLPDTQESLLELLALEDLPSQFQQNSISVGDTTSPENIPTASSPLYRLVLGLLLMLLLTESFAAWYLGNARA